MRAELAELWRYRHLLRMLVARELKVRYKNSVLGFMWSIVPPVLQVLVFQFLYRGILGVKVPNLSAYILSGIIPWSFFSTAILDSSQSLLINYTIIRKVYLPREAIPLASVISNSIHFLLGWAVYFIAFLVILPLFHGGIPLLPSMAFFPFITLMEALLVTGMAFWVSILNVFYEDVKFILQTTFQLAFFVIPVLYPADLAYYSSHMIARHPWLYQLYMLNPITAIIDAYRHALLQSIRPHEFNASLSADLLPRPFDGMVFAGACLIIVCIFFSGYAYFNRRKWQVVERP